MDRNMRYKDSFRKIGEKKKKIFINYKVIVKGFGNRSDKSLRNVVASFTELNEQNDEGKKEKKYKFKVM